MLLVIAVAVIGGGVFIVTEVQRRNDASSFVEDSAVRELRDATMQMAIASKEANAFGVDASEEVEAAERELALSIAAVTSRFSGRSASQRGSLRRQAEAATEMAELADKAATDSRPSAATDEPAVAARHARLESRRGELLDRFVDANDALLATLAREREQQQLGAARRPVLLVSGLFLIFGLLHLLFVERPAKSARRRLSAQTEFIDAMQVARSEAEAYDVISRHVERSADALRVTVLNRNNSADRLEAVTPIELDSAIARGLAGARPDSCLAVRLARTYNRAPDHKRLLRCDVCGMSADQTTCVPSLVAGEVIGAVLVEHSSPLGRDCCQVIEHSVVEAAPVVANLRNLAVAEMRAATDGLTGLANQRTIHETLKRAAAQAGRSASPLALVLFDLDHFKAINDTYGHGKGDDMLAAVGATAANAVRASDYVGRLGGEEFAVVLPDTNRTGGVEAAEKIRTALTTISVPGIDRPITASFGVAVMPDDAGEPDLLLREADRALYAAKRGGRDRVEAVHNAARTLVDAPPWPGNAQ